jgi:hypothetical protein
VKIDVRFPRRVGLVLLAGTVLLAYPLARLATRETIVAAVAGAALSTINVLLGFLATEYSFEKSYTTFVKAVLGGMVARMMIMLGAMVALILLFHVDAVALTVSMLGFYLVYLVMEVQYIQQKVLVRNRESHARCA